jgi:mannose-6-phosphate isomerase-like protein (cupin superfamily)
VVFFFLQGSGSMEIDARTLAVKAGDVVLIEDGEFHRVHNSGQEILEFVCVFDGQREH